VATSLRVLRALGAALVDTNGQHAAIGLKDADTQLALLDRIAGGVWGVWGRGWWGWSVAGLGLGLGCGGVLGWGVIKVAAFVELCGCGAVWVVGLRGSGLAG
jgi:hypothetical protein